MDTSVTMMTTFTFSDSRDLINFLYYHSVIGTWEVELARLVSKTGVNMDLTTQKRDSNNILKYSTLNNIKILIDNFLINNSYSNTNIELKLRYPDSQRHIMDINDYYSVFWLNCFCNPSNNIYYISISFLENQKELSIDPIKSWAIYIHSLYNDYQNSKQ